MCITYIVEDKLYVNITNKCSNRCEFCIRNNGDGAYGSDSLWLEREPTREEILESIFSWDLSAFPELVFCGYGEPTYRLDDAVFVAKTVKEKFPKIKVRINTNGHSDFILGRETAPEYEGAFDIVSISLNTPSRERYQQICHSIFGEDSFDALLHFASEVKRFVPIVSLSAVKETLSSEEIEQCREICDSLGVTLRLRDYIPPES
ncbi:MAG: TatD family nuclease-associated radical SAM protein [Clostridia bacterium]|nr:TatD family nuclease-associated radical SAM protein [Clostridia bacterium]